MRGTRRGPAFAVAGVLAALAICAIALAGPARPQKQKLGPAFTEVEQLVAYDESRLLLITRAGRDAFEIARINADGSLDRSFGDAGRLEIEFSNLLVEPGGKLLLVGSGPSPTDPKGSDAQLTRLLPNGRGDRSFGGDGVVKVDLGGRYDDGTAVALVAGGKIVIGGTKQTYVSDRGGGSDGSPVLVRLNPDGTLDGSFARGGVRRLPGGSEGGVFDIAEARHGAIVAAGEAFLGVEAWKLTASGAMDRRFGKGGRVNLQGRGREPYGGPGELLEMVPGVGVTPAGKVVLVGTGSRSGRRKHIYRIVALRLRRDGEIDRSYGRGGYAVARFHGTTFADGVAFRPGGAMLVAATAQVPDSKESDVGLIALDRNGHIDRRFGRRGLVRVDVDGWDFAKDVVVQSGKAIVLSEPNDVPGKWLVRVPLGGSRVR